MSKKQKLAPSHRRGMLPPIVMTPNLKSSLEQFESILTAGYSEKGWDDAVRCLSDISRDAPYGVVEKLGSVWSDAYVDTSGVSAGIAKVLRDHYSV